MKEQKRRRQILQEIAAIETMEKGRLTEEYRERVVNGKNRRLGPYFKYQRWEDGRNLSRRVPVPEVPGLREAVENYHRFEALSQEYADLTIAMTRQSGQDSKKKPRS